MQCVVDPDINTPVALCPLIGALDDAGCHNHSYGPGVILMAKHMQANGNLLGNGGLSI